MCIAIFSSASWASKARMTALGQPENGSYYISDPRNIFLNPAEIVLQKEQVGFEWGDNDRPPTSGIAGAHAEGGFIQSYGAGKMGLFLGRVPALTESTRVANISDDMRGALGFTGTNGFNEVQDTVELIYGSQGPTTWGGSFLYGQSKDETGTDLAAETKTFEFRGGMLMDNMSAHGRLVVGGESKEDLSTTSHAKYTSDLALRLGGSLGLAGNRKAYAELGHETFDTKNTNSNNSYDGTLQFFEVGLVQFREIDASAQFFYSVALNWFNWEANGSGTLATEELKLTLLPITIGIEADATSWMKLRGSVAQNVVVGTVEDSDGGVELKDDHNPNSTLIGAGIGLNFNKFTLDATFAGATTGNLDSNEFFANTSLHYVF